MNIKPQEGGFRMAEDCAENRHDWGTTRVVCDPASTGARQITALDAVFDPGGGHAFHMHPEQEELLYVLAGRIEQWVGREKRMLGPGDSAFIPAGLVHASFPVGDAPGRLLAIFSPCVGETGFTTVEMAHEEPWSTLRG